VAVRRNDSTLLVVDSYGGTHAIHVFSVADGSRLRVIGGAGDGPLQFHRPRQVWIAPDGYVFVADTGNKRVQVLTPQLDFHAFVGVGSLNCPFGVCANDDTVLVCDIGGCCVCVFSRGDGALVRRFASLGNGDGQLCNPYALCFTSDDRHVAVADCGNHRLSVFSVGGEFIRHLGVGVLKSPHGVACSAFDEIVVADWGNHRVVVFGADGELSKTMGCDAFTGVALQGVTIFAHRGDSEKCVVFS
jgi:DNA-binding beta-propeller fold protein YncE